MTSPAIKLARECGAGLVWGWWAMSEEELDRFYAKVQAQALRDAAAWFDEHETDSAAHLRRMADEKEKKA